MRITLKEDLPFIHAKGIREAYLELQRDGVYALVSNSFKQMLKKREYDAVLVAAGVTASTPEASAEEAAETGIAEGTKVSWEGKKGDQTGEVLELIEKGERARVRSDVDDKVYKVEVSALTIVK